MDKKEPVDNMKSPFTGGKVSLCTKEVTLKYRGEDITVNRDYYHCEDTGMEFSDSKLDDDLMWRVFRKYCEKQGFGHFSDILPHLSKIAGSTEPPKITGVDSQLKWKTCEKEMHVVTKCLVYRYDEIFGHEGFEITNHILPNDWYIPVTALINLPVKL